MNAQSLREAAISAPRKQEDVPTPFWPGTDGQIAIADIPMDTITELRDLAKRDPGAYSAAILIKTLVSKETGESVFSDADRDWLKSQSSIVLALLTPVNTFFGFDVKAAIETAKNG